MRIAALAHIRWEKLKKYDQAKKQRPGEVEKTRILRLLWENLSDDTDLLMFLECLMLQREDLKSWREDKMIKMIKMMKKIMIITFNDLN